MTSSIRAVLVLSLISAACAPDREPTAAVVQAAAPPPPAPEATAAFCDVKMYPKPVARAPVAALAYNERVRVLGEVDALWTRVEARGGQTGYVRTFALRAEPGPGYWVADQEAGCTAPHGMRPGTEQQLARKALGSLARTLPRGAAVTIDPIAGDDTGSVGAALAAALQAKGVRVVSADGAVDAESEAIVVMGALGCSYHPSGREVKLTLTLDVRDLTTGSSVARAPLRPVVKYMRNCPSA